MNRQQARREAFDAARRVARMKLPPGRLPAPGPAWYSARVGFLVLVAMLGTVVCAFLDPRAVVLVWLLVLVLPILARIIANLGRVGRSHDWE